MSVALCKFVLMSHKMFSEYSSARNFKVIVQKYYTNFLPSAVSQELHWGTPPFIGVRIGTHLNTNAFMHESRQQ